MMFPSPIIPLPTAKGTKVGTGRILGDFVTDDPFIPMGIFPPQPMMDSAREDGPVSVAFGLQPRLVDIQSAVPSPNTRQYRDRVDANRRLLELTQPPREADMCGSVIASILAEDAEQANYADAELQGIQHNEFRRVWQSISGFALMIWRDQTDFEEGVYGARRAPRPIGCWDLRTAFDIRLDTGDPRQFMVANRICVLMTKGTYFFCCQQPEDVPMWMRALRKVLETGSFSRALQMNTGYLQEKRWPAVVGVAQSLLQGLYVGNLAMAVLFHSFDMDYDCKLRLGELMFLVMELLGAVYYHTSHGAAEGTTRDGAVMAAVAPLPDGDIFEHALTFRRACDRKRQGYVDKDEFITWGLDAICQMLELPVPHEPEITDSLFSGWF